MRKTLLFLLFSLVVTFSFSQNSPTEYYISALVNDSLKDYPSALHDLDNAFLLKPDYDSALCLLGTIKFKQG